MILTTVYGLVTLVLIIAFIWLCIWAYSPSRKKQFMNDANIPFMDEKKKSSFQGDKKDE